LVEDWMFEAPNACPFYILEILPPLLSERPAVRIRSRSPSKIRGFGVF